MERVLAPERSSDEATDIEPAAPVTSYLERLHSRHATLVEGTVATYIPELAKADPTWFGIALTTVDGGSYEVGDSRQPFTIQSISKPLTYGLAFEDLGEAAVRRRIGVEPTGDAFNSITLAPGTGSPLNPMVNSGAIAAASLIHDGARTPAAERIVDHAHTIVECHVLEADAFDRLTVEQPALACVVLANLLRVVGRTARRMTGEVALLAG